MHYLTTSKALGYSLVFGGMIIEGDAVLFTAAFLAHQHYFDWGDVLLVVLSGVFIGDILWYYLGFKLNNSPRFTLLRRWLDRISKTLDAQLQQRPLKIIFISKFLYGLHHAVLMRVGNLKLPLNKFLQTDAIAIVLWVTMVGGLGYLSGVSFPILKRSIKFAEVVLAAGFLIFLSLPRLIQLGITKNSNKPPK